MAAVDAPSNNVEAQLSRTSAHKRKQPTSTVLQQHTLRKPQWTYLHLALHRSPPFSSKDDPLDPITARTHLTSALQQFLGLTGAAIPIDILKTDGHNVWVRMPREDGQAVVAAVTGWVKLDQDGDGSSLGWKVKGRDDWLARLVGGDGMDLFDG